MPKTPKPSPRETATAHMNVNFTPSEMELVSRAAQFEDAERFPSRWVRKVALRAARQTVAADPAPHGRRGSK